MLNNRTALVTGSTSGIGLGIAEQLAAAGANVVINGFGDAADIAAIVARLDGLGGGRVSFGDADMRDGAAVRALVERVAAEHGSLDILVNNAGNQHVAPIEEFPVEKWNDIIAINLSSAFHASAAAVPHMKAAGWGRIVMMASAHALAASPFKAAYVAAKHGIAGLTKTIALELAEHGVTCNAICPGYVYTPLV
ncbi:MAG: SDR family NAD(P)-dependent oxidoreductase, partial [Gammaproteobacteria bacterium]